ncbi:translation elongation factor 4 [Candidatus Woesebacteria bacterium]|nr:translation elongation factor 4 [Candidatus Woesebacteria bacterium]
MPIRNFCIIAHIDHGKTTLTDCLLRYTGAVQERQFRDRLMDSNPIERERGITIKLAPVRMNYALPVATSAGKAGESFELNLIDTPGHVDFGYEVSRSLAACEGALLVVDASQGVQAQTLSTFEKARALGLTVIPVINKVDLPSADVDQAVLEMMELTGMPEESILRVSAKNRLGIAELLVAIIERIPAPAGIIEAPTRGLLVTSLFDQHRGAIAIIRMVDGSVSSKQKLRFMQSAERFTPVEVGFFAPGLEPTQTLSAGQVGYIATGLKDVRGLKIGDTLILDSETSAEALPGYREPQPAVYMELYPTEADEFPLLQDAMSKLVLRDAALQYAGVYSQALGSGLRVGFLGILHAEIVLERLQREFDLSLIATSPSVTYKVKLSNGEQLDIYSASQWPDPSQLVETQEPLVRMELFTPADYLGAVLKLVRDRRGDVTSTQQIGLQLKLTVIMPLAELITDFHDSLKALTSGYGSFDYDMGGHQVVNAVKVAVMLNHEIIDSLSFVCVEDQAEQRGRVLVEKLKEALPRQQFEVPIQAAIGGRVIARETIKAYRKDVTAKLYGGDATRRKKLLVKQAKGKKRLKQFGKVEIDQDTFLKILRR